MNALNSVSSVVGLNGAQFAAPLIAVEDTRTFKDKCASFDDATVAEMVKSIEESVERRTATDTSRAAWSTESARILNNKGSLARFFLALGKRASDVIENRVVSGKYFNAYACKKIVELAQFANSGKTYINGKRTCEMVMSSFIICALAFDARNEGEAISNRVNKSFLSSNDLSKLVADEELAEYMTEYQHKYMTGGKDTQSSQARRVLDILGLGEIVNCENRSRGGIVINGAHSFFADFAAAYTK